MTDIKLTEWTSCGGCAAKWGGSPLRALVNELASAPGTDLLIGLAPYDDAAVYKLNDDVALVSTTDFFPPLVDDPADFGAIAAANACSDVFAMGGAVRLALNIAAFPESLPVEVIEAIFAAAAAVVADAGGTIAGGHTIRSDEPIFGLAVQGIVHPDRIWTKAGARAGDVLVLSKPIGTGIVLAGEDDDAKRAAITHMRMLNRAAAETLGRLPTDDVHAVTDVTGYGLFGHGWEIAERSNVAVRLNANDIPLHIGARAAADNGVRTGGDARNRTYVGEHVHVASGVPDALVALGYDPQTSGGLLAAVAPNAVNALAADGFTVVGHVADDAPGVELSR